MQSLEARYELQPSVEPLSDREMELYSDSVIMRPFEARLQARTDRMKRQLETKRAEIKERQEQLKREEAARLHRTQSFVQAVRELQHFEEKRLYGH